jgi:hypothetical protein
MPSYLEYGNSPGFGAYSWAGSGSDNYREWYWANVVGFAGNPDYIAFNRNWSPYVTSLGMRISDCMSNPACGMIYFRDLEYPTWTFDPLGYSYSGIRGDAGHNLTLANATAYPQGCNTNLKNAAATVVAGLSEMTIYQPIPCNWTPLPTPAATIQPTYTPNAAGDFNMLQRLANRQARQIGANQTMTITMDSDWIAVGRTYTETGYSLIYMDDSATDFSVVYPVAAGTTVTETVHRGDTKLWQDHQWTDDAYITAGGAIKIVNGASPLWVHALMVNGIDAGLSNTPTPSPTATRTPSPTSTSSPTFTPAPTSTPSYLAGVRFNEISPTDYYDWNLSGNVSPADRWYEIINWQTTAQQMAGWQIGNGTDLYTFPTFDAIAPGARRAFLAEDTLTVPVSGTLTLYNALGVEQDSVIYMTQVDGLCYATQPDGSASWSSDQECTPGRTN